MTNQTRPTTNTSPGNTGESPKAPRFIETREVRRVPLSNHKADEEARLAAEIEKLRD
jgi:hypothetical protein